MDFQPIIIVPFGYCTFIHSHTFRTSADQTVSLTRQHLLDQWVYLTNGEKHDSMDISLN